MRTLQLNTRSLSFTLPKLVALALWLCIAANGWAQVPTADKPVAEKPVTEEPVVKEPQQTESDKRAENLPEGINDSFLNPDMDVEEFIKRFEVESREVFACRMQILDAVQLKPGMAVADIGAGTGLYIGAFAEKVGSEGKVYAVDISPKFVKHLRDRAKKEELGNVEAVLCTDRDVKLEPNTIDRAFICDVYHHFEYPASSMASIYKAMRKDGKLIVVDFHRQPDVSPQRKEWLSNHIRAPQEVFKQEIIDAGFEFEEEVAIEGFSENYLLRFTKK